MDDKQRKCNCSRRRAKLANKKRERCSRMRSAMVYNPEKKNYCEPYMDKLRALFSPAPSECPSGVELPWDDIALNESDLPPRKEEPKVVIQKIEPVIDPLIRKVSSGKMCIPWEQLIVKETLQSAQAKLTKDLCESSVEIPWEDIMFDPKIEIKPSDKDLIACPKDELEIPWNDFLMPQNIVFYPKKTPPSPRKKSKTRSKKCNCSKH